jgi:hypothetical protein
MPSAPESFPHPLKIKDESKKLCPELVEGTKLII